MKLTGTILTVVILFIAFIGKADAQVNTGRFSVSYNDNGVTRYIYVYVPESYDSTKTYPFLFGWHGASMPGSDMRDILYAVIARDIEAIVVCPDANQVQTGDQLNSLINNSLYYATNNYKLDPEKFIVTGFSWGGQIAYQLGLQNPTLFKGIIGLSPAIGTGQFSQTMWDNIGKIRMATILGDKDFNYDAVNSLMESIINKGGQLLYKIKPGVEHADNTYYNSQEFLDDYKACYDYVTSSVSAVTDISTDICSIKISPNPAAEFINVQFSAAGSESVSLELLDIQGNSLMNKKLSGGHEFYNESLDISGLPNGLYILKLNIGSSYMVKKVIKGY